MVLKVGFEEWSLRLSQTRDRFEIGERDSSVSNLSSIIVAFLGRAAIEEESILRR